MQTNLSTSSETIGASVELEAPLCRRLRSKRMYEVNSFSAEAQADENTESAYGHYWCTHTMYEFGPDGDRVKRKVCKPGRSCYEPG